MELFLIAYLIVTILTLIFAIGLAWYAWRHSHIIGAGFLSLYFCAITQISFSFLGLSFSTTPEQAYFFSRFRFLGISFGMYFFLLFVVEYSSWLIPKFLLYGLVLPAIFLQFIIWTPLDQFFYQNWHMIDRGIIRVEVFDFGLLYTIYYLLIDAYLASAFFRLLYYTFRVESAKRVGVWWMSYGVAATIVAALPIINRSEWMLPRLLPFGLLVMECCVAVALSRHDFFTVIPIAYDLVVQNMRAAVFVLNHSKILMQSNPYAETLLEKDKSALLHMPIAEIFKHSFELDFPAELEDAVWEFQQIKDEKLYNYEASLSSLKRSGVSLGYLFILRDISIYKENETKTIALGLEKERLRLLSEFVNHTSHDLRTPLATINSSLYLLKKQPDAERLDKAVLQIGEQSQRIETILRQFHLFVSIETATHPISHVSINELSQSLLEEYRAKCQQANVKLSYIQAPHHCIIEGNISLLREALGALIHNALIYNQSGGEICLETREHIGKVCISVRDTGIGIPPEKLSHIFDSFYKVNQARTSDGSGAGIGLALVQRVAKLYQGEVQIESELGRGTEVRLILPLFKEKQNQA